MCESYSELPCNVRTMISMSPGLDALALRWGTTLANAPLKAHCPWNGHFKCIYSHFSSCSAFRVRVADTLHPIGWYLNKANQSNCGLYGHSMEKRKLQRFNCEKCTNEKLGRVKWNICAMTKKSLQYCMCR